jgi:hypothetical protein
MVLLATKTRFPKISKVNILQDFHKTHQPNTIFAIFITYQKRSTSVSATMHVLTVHPCTISEKTLFLLPTNTGFPKISKVNILQDFDTIPEAQDIRDFENTYV